jgi:hypothetical protein
MNRILMSAIAGLTAVLITGCSTVGPAGHFGTVPIESLKSAYVVIAPRGNPNIGQYIELALAQHHIKTNIGAPQDKPKDVDFYVNYKERWNWDVTVYLESLDVEFVDNATDKTIATGKFRQGFFHTFPDPRDKTIEVIDSMYPKK